MAPHLLGCGPMRALDVPESAASPAWAAEAPASADPVLVVDDDAVCCELMATALERDGHRVEWTSDPMQAVRLVRVRRYAVVVSDVNMPDVSGVALAAEAKLAYPGIRTLLVTGVADPRVRAQAAAIGSELLSKPIRVEELCAAVRTLLGRRAALESAT